MFKLNRRRLISGGMTGLLAAFGSRQVDAWFGSLDTTSKRCIVLWMAGGPSQFETFDPKPGTKTGGDTRAIPTAVTGVHISESLPLVASRLDKLSIIRNLTSAEGDHDRGDYYLHTGFKPVPSFPRPPIGAVISRNTPEVEIPKYVSLGGKNYGPAYMGPEHAPFIIEDANQAKELLQQLRSRGKQLSLLGELNSEFEALHPDAVVQQRRAMLQRVERIVRTKFIDALNLDLEPAASRSRYGETDFGRNCLLARRLIEAGVRFVEVQLDGWDTHIDNFDAVRNLCGQLDRPWATLIDDLSASGLLDETVVIWMGEFGRTPTINGTNGRDHFPDVTPVVIGGGGLTGGQVIGQTNRDGTEIVGAKVEVADLFATILSRFDISADAPFITDFGSPTKATENGRLIDEIVGRHS